MAYIRLTSFLLLVILAVCSQASLGLRSRVRRDRDGYGTDQVEQCVHEWENCFRQTPLLSRMVTETNFFSVVSSLPLKTSCSELKLYLTCSRRNVASCASTSGLQREVKNFANLETLLDTLCGAERNSLQALLPCISSQNVADELQQCSDIHLTYSECDGSGFWICIDNAITEGCGSDAESFMSRIGDKLRVQDVGCPEINED